MRHLITTALIIALLLSGCVQIIHERPDGTRLKVNTLFKSVTSEGFYYDPNEFMQSGRYEGISDKLEIQYNPYTGVKLKTKGK